MPFVIGSFTRDAQDDETKSVDFGPSGVFDSSPVTSAVVSASPTDLTLGSATVATNVVSFRVYGGTAGSDYVITVRATNSAGTPAVLERHLRCTTV